MGPCDWRYGIQLSLGGCNESFVGRHASLYGDRTPTENEQMSVRGCASTLFRLVF
jgi:hypothetical protein